MAPFLICALLAPPGCGIVKGVARRSLVRFLSGTVAAMIFGVDEAASDDGESVEEDDAAGSGFYKVVEANGIVRFVSSLAEVAAAQRTKAERIDSQPSGGGHEVVVYTTSWCGWCKKTRAWLDQQGVDYENRDVEANAEWAEEMHDLTGSGGVPVIVIDGEVIKGFNPAQLEKLLRG